MCGGRCVLVGRWACAFTTLTRRRRGVALAARTAAVSTWATPGAAPSRSDAGPPVRGIPERRLNPHEYPSLGAAPGDSAVAKSAPLVSSGGTQARGDFRATRPQRLRQALMASPPVPQDPRRWADDERDVADLRSASQGGDWGRSEDHHGDHGTGSSDGGSHGYAARGPGRDEPPLWERRREEWPARGGSSGWGAPERERPYSGGSGPGSSLPPRGAFGYGTAPYGAQDVRRAHAPSGEHERERDHFELAHHEAYDFPPPRGMGPRGVPPGRRGPEHDEHGFGDPDRAAYDADVARAAAEQQQHPRDALRPRSTELAEEQAPAAPAALLAHPPHGGPPLTPDRPPRVLSRANVDDVSAAIRAAAVASTVGDDSAHALESDDQRGPAPATESTAAAAAAAAAAEAERGRLAKRSAEAEAARLAAAAEEERRKAAARAKLLEIEQRQAAKAAAESAAAAAAAAAAAVAPPPALASVGVMHDAPMAWRSAGATAPPPARAGAAWGALGGNSAPLGGFAVAPSSALGPLFSVPDAVPSQQLHRLGLGGADGADAGMLASHSVASGPHAAAAARNAGTTSSPGIWGDAHHTQAHTHGAVGASGLSVFPLALSPSVHAAAAPDVFAPAHSGVPTPSAALPPPTSTCVAGDDVPDGAVDSQRADSPSGADSERRKRGGRRVREADERRASRAAGSTSSTPAAAPPARSTSAVRKELPRPRVGDAAGAHIVATSDSAAGERGGRRAPVQPNAAAASAAAARALHPPPVPLAPRSRGRGLEPETPSALLPQPTLVAPPVLSWGSSGVWAPPTRNTVAPPLGSHSPGGGNSNVADDALLLSHALPTDLSLDAASYTPAAAPAALHAPSRATPHVALPFTAFGTSAGGAATWAPTPMTSSSGIDTAFFTAGGGTGSASSAAVSGGGSLFGAPFPGGGVALPYGATAQYGQLAAVYGGSMWAHTPMPPPSSSAAVAQRKAGGIFGTATASASVAALPASFPMELGGAGDAAAEAVIDTAPVGTSMQVAAASGSGGGNRGNAQHRGR